MGLAPRWNVIAAFAAIYLIWGSTYLGIRFAVESMPPFLMMAARWTLAGLLVLPFAWRAARERPTWIHWRSALVVGALLPLAGNGGVAWAQSLGLASGLTALLVAMVPMWLVLFDWLRPNGLRPTPAVVAGLLLGLGGVALLVRPWDLGTEVTLVGAGLVTLATCGWALGSIYSRHAPLPRSPTLATGMEMLMGGLLLFVAAIAKGEARGLDLAAVTGKSWMAAAYLTVFGSVVAFLAYVWLLRVSTPAKVGTYAFVNPVVAVVLGALMASEPLTGRTLLAGAVIVAGVAIITFYRGRAAPQVPAPPPAAASPRPVAVDPSAGK